tara:strand:+ start:420 stop:611 length:192 start_codon:yes stop_codon:yes gene_type:complete
MGLDIKKANKVTEFTNNDVSKLVASSGSGKDLLEFANNAAAVAAGLAVGDLYTTTGAVMIVTV